MSAGEHTAEDRLVRAAATQLYAGAPAEFIGTRTALVTSAKADGEQEAAKRIAVLRRPSVAAWALNQLVHRADPVIEDLADLGARLRHATSALDAVGLAGLRGPRDAALASLVAAAATVAAAEGHKLTAAVEAEVRDTGIAALADEAAEGVLRSGTLTRALSYSGFGEVDLSEATATTSTGVVLTSLRGGRRRSTEVGQEPEEQTHPQEPEEQDDEPEDDAAEALAEAAAEREHQHRVAQAQAAVDRATTEIGRHRAAVEAARNRSDATRQRVQKLVAQLEAARTEDDLSLEKLTEAVSAAKRAEADLTSARETLAELEEPPES